MVSESSSPVQYSTKLIKNRPHEQLQCIRTIKRGCGSNIFDLHMLICTCIILNSYPSVCSRCGRISFLGHEATSRFGHTFFSTVTHSYMNFISFSIPCNCQCIKIYIIVSIGQQQSLNYVVN